MTREHFDRLLALQQELETSHAEFCRIIARAEKGRDDTYERYLAVTVQIEYATCTDIEFDEDWQEKA